MKIVIADDDRNLLDMLVPYLEHAGHQVTLAGAGDELLEKIKEARADLIISDITMPGMDGVALYKQVRRMPEYGASPFILWSGLEAERAQALVREDHKLAFLKKPFSLAALTTAIVEVTDLPLFGDYSKPKPDIKF